MSWTLDPDTLGRAAAIAGVLMVLVLAVIGIAASIMVMLMVIREGREPKSLRLPTGNTSKAGTPKPQRASAL